MQGLTNTWPVKMDVSLAPATEGSTTVRADGRVGGFGPIQSAALD